MRVIDLTHTVSPDMPVYPGTEPPRLDPANTYERDGFRETLITMFSHTGTHMDAPAHLYPGRTTLDRFPAEQFCGKALSIDCRDLAAGQTIPFSRIQKVRRQAEEADFILFNTGWDRYWGKPEYFGDYPYPDEETVDYLLSSRKKGVGLDAIGIDPIRGSGLAIHKKLFREKEMVIIENLTNLDKVGRELFTFFALPLKYLEGDGSPIRAIAFWP